MSDEALEYGPARTSAMQLRHMKNNRGMAMPRKAREADKRKREQPRQASSRRAGPGLPREIGGPRGPEPTRYGDWEVKGRCSDF